MLINEKITYQENGVNITVEPKSQESHFTPRDTFGRPKFLWPTQRPHRPQGKIRAAGYFPAQSQN